MKYPEYFGLSYEAASIKALELINHAAKSEAWFDLPARLLDLRTIMRHHERLQERSRKIEAAKSGMSRKDGSDRKVSWITAQSIARRKEMLDLYERGGETHQSIAAKYGICAPNAAKQLAAARADRNRA